MSDMIPRRLGYIVCALALTGLGSVRAEVWAFIDSQGVPHFAGHQVDARYQLFFLGPAQEMLAQPIPAPASAVPAPARPAAGDAGPAAIARDLLVPAGGDAGVRPRLLGVLERSPAYKRVLPLVQDVARQLGLDASLMVALIAAESGFNPRAVSPKGAVGLMQLMPGTAQRYGVRPQDGASLEERLMQPEINLRAGATFLRDLLLMFPGRLDLALAAYNAGPGAVQRAGHRIPAYPETQNYVRVVTELLRHLRPPVVEPVETAAQPPAQPLAPVVAATPAPNLLLAPSMAGAVARGILLAPPALVMSPAGAAPDRSASRD
jgi:hypothetical protein